MGEKVPYVPKFYLPFAHCCCRGALSVAGGPVFCSPGERQPGGVPSSQHEAAAFFVARIICTESSNGRTTFGCATRSSQTTRRTQPGCRSVVPPLNNERCCLCVNLPLRESSLLCNQLRDSVCACISKTFALLDLKAASIGYVRKCQNQNISNSEPLLVQVRRHGDQHQEVEQIEGPHHKVGCSEGGAPQGVRMEDPRALNR